MLAFKRFSNPRLSIIHHRSISKPILDHSSAFHPQGQVAQLEHFLAETLKLVQDVKTCPPKKEKTSFLGPVELGKVLGLDIPSTGYSRIIGSVTKLQSYSHLKDIEELLNYFLKEPIITEEQLAREVEGLQTETGKENRPTSERTVAKACGTRKTAKAQVTMVKGTGEIIVNGVPIHDFCKYDMLKVMHYLVTPFYVTDTINKFNAVVVVNKGGVFGKAGAIRLAFSKCLAYLRPELHPVLTKAGLLVVDTRVRERKKPGLRRARAKFRYKKR